MNFPFSILPEADFDVVGFGTNAVDYLIRVPEYPAFNSKIELNNYSVAAGGEVASSMVGLRRLGLKTAYVGRLGGDHAGVIGLNSLTDERVDTTYVEVIQDALTQVAFILIDEKSGERTVIWQRDSKLAYTAVDAPVSAAACGRILHLTPHDVDACIEMAMAAKIAGAVISADIDNVFEGIENLLPLVDVCLVSGEFPAKLFQISDKKESLKKLSSVYGCSVTGMTCGEKGSLILCGGEFIETAGFDVPGGCIDTTGAGDAFRAGFVYGMLSGMSVEQTARAANAVAALKCRNIGARTALPIRSELDAFLK